MQWISKLVVPFATFAAQNLKMKDRGMSVYLMFRDSLIKHSYYKLTLMTLHFAYSDKPFPGFLLYRARRSDLLTFLLDQIISEIIASQDDCLTQ